MLSITSLCWPG